MVKLFFEFGIEIFRASSSIAGLGAWGSIGLYCAVEFFLQNVSDTDGGLLLSRR